MEEINERKEEAGTGQQKGMLRDVLKLSLRCWQVVFQRKPLQRLLASLWQSVGRTGRCKFFSSVNASGALKGDSVLKQSLSHGDAEESSLSLTTRVQNQRFWTEPAS